MDHLQLINNFIETLPHLAKGHVPEDLSCPICLVSFEDIFNDVSTENSFGGVTQLPSCKHIFCRNDLTEWIRKMHGSCPSCRRVFLDVRPPSDSDGESSDGGEYIPNDDDDDEEDLYMVDTDGFTDPGELDVEMVVDLDVYQTWEPSEVGDELFDDGASEWGLTDGDSLSNSDGDTSLGSEEASPDGDTGIVIQDSDDDNVDVHADDK
ncbi:hypothetical protein BDP27DRAFT_1314667 [Rhodocollybia butyracea]|uniref:RING-type domain-containing protein n=1 Tax=Rhodocollybia butyracea TaxID=206335 RepID=A0A9P5Q753_9AGAR|nr:hypothetical protein BDP27DRAFT_1314667 [Rhodocollybia butyracea]